MTNTNSQALSHFVPLRDLAAGDVFRFGFASALLVFDRCDGEVATYRRGEVEVRDVWVNTGVTVVTCPNCLARAHYGKVVPCIAHDLDPWAGAR